MPKRPGTSRVIAGVGAALRAALSAVLVGLAAAAASIPGCSPVVECQGPIVDGFCRAACPDGHCSPDAGVITGPEPCADNSQCDGAHGFVCVSGVCRLACRSHFDCAESGLGECQPATDAAGTVADYCAPVGNALKGQLYTQCPYGTECDSAHGFICIGSGVGDLAAYCTRDCSTDADCADGFYCGQIRKPPCQDICGQKGAPLDPTCVPSEEIGPGLGYQCDPYGVTRTVCREREFCSSCSQDADCLSVPNGVCAKDQSGASICTQLCDMQHPSCPWGTAGVCGLWSGNTAPTCAHRFQACQGTGKGCEPCVQSSDCGADGLCTSSSFSGERWCVDVNAHCSCNGMADANGLCAGGGCPPSPSGLDMICVDDPMSTLRGACYGANTAQNLILSSQQAGCWPAQ